MTHISKEREGNDEPMLRLFARAMKVRLIGVNLRAAFLLALVLLALLVMADGLGKVVHFVDAMRWPKVGANTSEFKANK
jgi:hypothetical protein